MIFASEDVGLADPQALVQALAAAQALERVGLPEAQLNLAQAAVYLATAPKSDAVAQAIWGAGAEMQSGLTFEVPPFLRDAHYGSAASLGHGVGYESPHRRSEASTFQSYLPDSLRGRSWYSPSNAGFEAEIRTRMGIDESTRSSAATPHEVEEGEEE